MNAEEILIYMGGQVLSIYANAGTGKALQQAMIKGDSVWIIHDLNGVEVLLNPKVIPAILVKEYKTNDNSPS